MSVDTDIQRLADAAIDIANIKDSDLRHRGGYWLHGELNRLYEDHLFTEDQRLDFMVVVKMLLDVIFSDAVDSAADLRPTLELPPSALEAQFQKAFGGG